MKKLDKQKLINYKCLADICNIILGHQFRERVSTGTKGKYRILLYKDVKVNEGIVNDVITRADVKNLKKDRILRNNDVLVIARGHYPRAIFIEKVPEKIVVSSFFFIMRPKNNQILPQYIAWYLNSTQLRNYLEKTSTGTVVPHLKIKILEGVKMPIPPIDKQKKIMEFYNLWQKEKSLYKKINQKKGKLVNEIIKTYTNNM